MKRPIALLLFVLMVLALPGFHLLTAREPHFASCVTPKFRNTGHIVVTATRIGEEPSDVDNRSKANFCLLEEADPEVVGGSPCVCP